MRSVDDNRLEGVSVLIAEDSWHLADAMRIMIERAGGNVVGLAGTLAEAERLSADLNYDAVLMDLNLHGKKAHGLAEKLAAAGTKVVVLSGYDRPPSLVATVHDCLMKPVAIEALISALASPPRG